VVTIISAPYDDADKTSAILIWNVAWYLTGKNQAFYAFPKGNITKFFLPLIHWKITKPMVIIIQKVGS